MYKPLRKHKLGKVLLFFFVLGMGIPVFLQPVIAAVDPGGDPPPAYIDCWAQLRAYKGKILGFDYQRFTFNILVSAHVLPLYGTYKLDNFIDTWEKLDLSNGDDYRAQQLWYDYEFYYDIGGIQIVGFSRTVAYRIRNTETGRYIDFELTACVHLWDPPDPWWYPPDYRSVSCNLTEGGSGSWEFRVTDNTYGAHTLYISWSDLH